MARPGCALGLATALTTALGSVACTAPPWSPPRVALRLAGGGRSWREDGRRRGAVHAALVLRLDAPDGTSAAPRAASTRAEHRLRCRALSASLGTAAGTPLARAASAERARALGCEVAP
jgi:hypothetical protein